MRLFTLFHLGDVLKSTNHYSSLDDNQWEHETMDQFKQTKEYFQRDFGEIEKNPNMYDGKLYVCQGCEEYKEFVSSFLNDNGFIPYSAEELATHRDAIEISGKTVKIVEYDSKSRVKIAELTGIDNSRTIRYMFLEDGALYSASEMNSVGNLVKEIHFFKGEITSGVENQYDEHNHNVKAIRFSDGKISEWEENQYDEQNNKIRKIGRNSFVFYDHKYCYDDGGNLIQETTLKADGSVESEVIYDRYGNLIKRICYWPDGRKQESEYQREFDAAGKCIKEIKLLNGSIEEEKIYDYTDIGIPIIKYTVGTQAVYYQTQREVNKHSETFGLLGRYHLKNEAPLSLLIILTESMISFFIKNGYDLSKIHCTGMSEIHSGIIGYDKSYTALEDFVQNVLIDYERENSCGWYIDFNGISSRLVKENNSACIGMHHDDSRAEVQLMGVREETKLFYIEMLQSISDTTGLVLQWIFVTEQDIYKDW